MVDSRQKISSDTFACNDSWQKMLSLRQQNTPINKMSVRFLTFSLFDRQQNCHHLPMTLSIQCHYLRRSMNSHKSGWAIIHCCWTTSLEQPTTTPRRDSQLSLVQFHLLVKTHLVHWGPRRRVNTLQLYLLTYLLAGSVWLTRSSGLC